MIDHIKPAESKLTEDKTEKISIMDQKIFNQINTKYSKSTLDQNEPANF